MDNILFNQRIFAERLAKRRKEKGFSSQGKLASEYNKLFPTTRKGAKDENKNNTSGILGTIKHYENDTYSGSPSLDKVSNLCDKRLLDCNIDYLIGKIETTTHEKEYIRNTTGLTENAIDTLSERKMLNDTFDDRPDEEMDLLNELIGTNEFWKLLQMINALRKAKNLHKEVLTTKYDSTFDRNVNLNNSQREIEVKEYQIQKYMTMILDQLTKEVK